VARGQLAETVFASLASLTGLILKVSSIIIAGVVGVCKKVVRVGRGQFENGYSVVYNCVIKLVAGGRLLCPVEKMKPG